MHPRARLRDWLDARTGYRTALRHLADEPLPGGAGWWFVTGSILLLLLGVQVATGVVLAMYYVPSPELAYDSVQYVTTALPFGGIVRGLHFFGASFIVIAAVVHMLRVILFGSYKKPREVTWLTGVALLLVILAFALTGYLLPWDQKAYWATTVTINIARSTPVVGEYIGSVLRGGAQLGALTLGRWYATHVFILPAALLGLVAAHLYLMRRHGVSGPVRPHGGPRQPFYPYHAFKDTLATAFVFAALLAVAVLLPAPLDPVADPSDGAYVPRPEWYFLWLFELLKHFPGPLEPLATMVIPGLMLGWLLLLPFVDRSRERHPLSRPLVTGASAMLLTLVATLTWLGMQDTPAHADPATWGPVSLGGRVIAEDDRCVRCHTEGGPATELDRTRLRRDPDWVVNHVRDPEVVGPGVRQPPEGALNEMAGHAVLAYVRKRRSGFDGPEVDADSATAVRVFATRCARCHAIDGEGDASVGGDLSQVGREHDARWLRIWISDPSTVDPTAEMPAFADTLSPEEMSAIVWYLARRK